MIGINVVSPNEYHCLENLEQYKILHTRSEPIFDRLAATAAKMLDVPLAMVNFVDNQKIWGLAGQERNTNYDTVVNISSIAVEKESIVKFERLTENPGLILNPMVLGELGLQFFASAAITTNEGLSVGTVCIIDDKSRCFSSIDQKKLDWIASMITVEMNKRIAVHAVA